VGALQGLLLDFFLMSLCALVMARDMRRRPGSGFFSAVRLGFIPVAVLSLLVFVSLQGKDQPEVAHFRQAFVDQVSHATLQLVQGQGAISTQDAVEAAQWVLRLYPGLQCLFWLCALSVISFLLRHWLWRRGRTKLPPPLSLWKAPDLMIWTVLLPAALVLLGDAGLASVPQEWRDLGLNILAVTLFIYLFQGAMVILERLRRLGIPKALGALLLVSGILLSVLAAGWGMAAGVLALGLLETWFDFRHLQNKDNDSTRSGA
jgi:hypothetical protein